MFIKSSSTWRQLIKLDKTDVCFVLNGVNILPMLNNLKNLVLKIAPTLPKKCPFNPQVISLENVIIMSPEMVEVISKFLSSISSTLMPNGVYRIVMRFHTENDPEGFLIFFHVELYYRLNDEVF